MAEATLNTGTAASFFLLQELSGKEKEMLENEMKEKVAKIIMMR